MKKMLLKICLAVIGVFMGMSFLPIIASADEISAEDSVEIVSSAETEPVHNEEETESIEETESAEWFDETIKPLLIEYGADVVAFVTVALIALKDTQKTKNALFGAVGAVMQSNTDNQDTAKAVKEFKEVCAEEIQRLKEAHAEEMQALKETFLTALNEIRESVAVKVDDIDDVAHKLLDVEKLAYGDNAHLVSNGTAKRIAEVIGNVKADHEE